MKFFGKKMKKTVFEILAISFATFVLFSCSNGFEKTSLTLTFNGSDFARTPSRNIIVGSNYRDYYLIVSILGDYTESKEIPFSEVETYGVTFSAIPVDAKISVQANVYDMNNEIDDNPNGNMHLYHIFTGASPEMTIRKAGNSVNLQLKRIDNDLEQIDNNFNFSVGYKTGTAYGDIVTSCSISFYSNSKYVITSYFDSEYTILSEGVWKGSLEYGKTLYIQECLFQTVTADNFDVESYDINYASGIELVSEPKFLAVPIGGTQSENETDRAFSFSSLNGLEFYISDIH